MTASPPTVSRTRDSHQWAVNGVRIDRRTAITIGLVVAAFVLETWTVLPGFELLGVIAVVAAPSIAFNAFWRFLQWLQTDPLLDWPREDSPVGILLRNRYRRDWVGWTALWATFGTFWFMDMVATVFLFVVPDVQELHPLTVFLYDLLGVPGAVLAAVSYALLFVTITRKLPRPVDFDFLATITLCYLFLVVHNANLLLSHPSVLAS